MKGKDGGVWSGWDLEEGLLPARTLTGWMLRTATMLTGVLGPNFRDDEEKKLHWYME